MRKPIAIQKYFGQTDGPTDTARCRVACPRLKRRKRKNKAGLIHGKMEDADSWAGAVMRKSLTIQKCDGRTDGRTDGPTDRPTRQGVESRVRD